jgi:hypothetical protein
MRWNPLAAGEDAGQKHCLTHAAERGRDAELRIWNTVVSRNSLGATHRIQEARDGEFDYLKLWFARPLTSLSGLFASVEYKSAQNRPLTLAH